MRGPVVAGLMTLFAGGAAVCGYMSGAWLASVVGYGELSILSGLCLMIAALSLMERLQQHPSPKGD